MVLVIRNALFGSAIVIHPLKVVPKESTSSRAFGNILSYFWNFSVKYKFLKLNKIFLKTSDLVEVRGSECRVCVTLKIMDGSNVMFKVFWSITH